MFLEKLAMIVAMFFFALVVAAALAGFHAASQLILTQSNDAQPFVSKCELKTH